MEDQDREARIDEDVEAHHNKNHVKTREDENDVEAHHNKNHVKTREDENDVEGHSHHAAKGHTKLANEEGDDDVEGHVFKQANVPHTKA